MELYRIIAVNLLMWGIPGIPTYYTYKMILPFVNDLASVVVQLIAVAAVYIILLIANHEIFWNNYYHKYLTEVKIKEEKDEKNKKYV